MWTLSVLSGHNFIIILKFSDFFYKLFASFCFSFFLFFLSKPARVVVDACLMCPVSLSYWPEWQQSTSTPMSTSIEGYANLSKRLHKLNSSSWSDWTEIFFLCSFGSQLPAHAPQSYSKRCIHRYSQTLTKIMSLLALIYTFWQEMIWSGKILWLSTSE